MRSVRLFRNQSGHLGSGTVFWEKRQIKQPRQGSRVGVGGGRDKRVGSLSPSSPWCPSEFPGTFFWVFVDRLPQRA